MFKMNRAVISGVVRNSKLLTDTDIAEGVLVIEPDKYDRLMCVNVRANKNVFKRFDRGEKLTVVGHYITEKMYVEGRCVTSKVFAADEIYGGAV